MKPYLETVNKSGRIGYHPETMARLHDDPKAECYTGLCNSLFIINKPYVPFFCRITPGKEKQEE